MVDLRIELPEGFLDEEVRCGHTVTREMKKVWAVELDLLAKLLDVCKQHNIKIFASGGTMLGAVRHHGFIPWDDDIDMAMFREDYKRLCEVADEAFSHPYFFQTEYTDPGSLRGHAQLRNSETTGILKSEIDKKRRFNQGIFIDIFPLDNVVDDKKAFEAQEKRVLWYKKLALGYASCSTRFVDAGSGIKFFARKLIHRMCYNACAKNEIAAYRKFEEACQKYNDAETEMISLLSFQFANRQHFKYREDYKELIEADFEFLKIMIGSNYHRALKCQYGEYMNPVKTGNLHGEVFFDADRPYADYLQD